MKILQLVTSRKSRGAEISAFLLSQQLIKRGHQIIWVGLYPVQEEKKLQLDVAENIDLNGNPLAFLDFSLLMRLRNLLKDFQPDIIQANGSDTWKYAVLALIGNSKPKLVYRNISIMSYWVRERAMVKYFYQMLAKRVAYFCSVGDQANQDIKNLLNLSAKKCGVIRRGIPINHFNRSLGRDYLKKCFGIEENDFVLIQVGSLSPEKNIGFSINLVDDLKNEIPNLKLLIAGEGNERKKLFGLIKKLNLQERIVLLGHQKEDLNSILAGSDLMLLTSLVEGVPGVILEAAVQRTPTIAVNVGGVGEVIQTYETGILIESHNIQEFTSAIVELFQSPEKRFQMGQEAFLYAQQNFSLEVNSRAFEELYQRLLGELG